MPMRPKIQHRWLVPPERQAALNRLPATRITQAFLGPNLGLCVRITDGHKADLTRTIGHGLKRFMSGPHPLDLPTAQLMISASRGVTIQFDRRHEFGMKFDSLDLPFEDVMIAEYEKHDEAATVELPEILDGAPEVTNWLSKRALANAVAYLEEGRRLNYERVIARVKRIALIGGPAAGKSKLLEELSREFDSTVHSPIHFLPEVATIVISQAKVLPPGHDTSLNRVFQRSVYDIQRTFEELAEIQARLDGKRLILTDRGTMDGCAYLAGGKPEFLRTIDTTEAEEFARYDRVVMLAPPPRAVWDELKASGDPTKWNEARKETYDEATRLSRRIRDIWGSHPGFHYVEATDWPTKAAMARDLILG